VVENELEEQEEEEEEGEEENSGSESSFSVGGREAEIEVGSLTDAKVDDGEEEAPETLAEGELMNEAG